MIRVPSVRLVDEEGNMIGITATGDAIRRAEDAGLDLVEVSPNADPPVCKILDYGKYKYIEQKKKADARKKQKTVEVKEIKMRPGIDTNDYDIKMRRVREFLEEGDWVKVTLRFRGREMMHREKGMDVLDRVRDDLGETAKIQQLPKMEGRQLMMVVIPAKSVTQQKSGGKKTQAKQPDSEQQTVAPETPAAEARAEGTD